MDQMKDSIDDLKSEVQDRTTELRDVQKYVKNLEKALVTDLKQTVEQSKLQCDYNRLDLRDELYKKLNVVGSKFMKSTKVASANKEAAEYGDIMQQRKLRTHARESAERC